MPKPYEPSIKRLATLGRAESAEASELKRIKALRRKYLLDVSRPSGMTFKQWLVMNDED